MDPTTVKRTMWAIEKEVHFNESLAALATISIFTLLGASLDITIITSNLLLGIVLASLPLTLGLVYSNQHMVHWGEIILGATVITVLVSVIVETLWVPFLRKRLLKSETAEKRVKRKHEIKRRRKSKS